MRLPSPSRTHWLILLLALSPPWVQANPSLKQPGVQTRAGAPAEAKAGIESETVSPPEKGRATSDSNARGGYCEAHSRPSPKTLLVGRLSSPNTNHNNHQGLVGIEQALPRRLGRELTSRGALILFREVDRELGQGQNHAELLRQAARETDTQLVLSGNLINTSGPDRNRGLVAAGRDALIAGLGLNPDWDSRQRQFVLALRLHDGITGDLLWRQSYHTQGVWRSSQAAASGRFSSPAFGQSHYGTRIEALLERALAELTGVIRCQPLAGWLTDRGPGTQPVLALGRRQGLSVGEEFKVYRLQQQPRANRYRSYEFLPSDTGYRVRIRQPRAYQSRVEWLGAGARPGRYLVISPDPYQESGEAGVSDVD